MSQKSPRRRAREFALQALYQWQLNQATWSVLNHEFSLADGIDRADVNLFKAITKGVIDEATPLSEALTPHLDRKWQELSPVEKAVMLIGAYELVHMQETPYRVIINEAVELAKSYGGTDGHKYVNGVLDKLAATVRVDEVGVPPVMKERAARPAAPVVSVTKKALKKVLG